MKGVLTLKPDNGQAGMLVAYIRAYRLLRNRLSGSSDPASDCGLILDSVRSDPTLRKLLDGVPDFLEPMLKATPPGAPPLHPRKAVCPVPAVYWEEGVALGDVGIIPLAPDSGIAGLKISEPVPDAALYRSKDGILMISYGRKITI